MTWYNSKPGTVTIGYLQGSPWKVCRVELALNKSDNSLDENVTKQNIPIAEANTRKLVAELIADASDFLESLGCPKETSPDETDLLSMIQRVIMNVEECAGSFAKQTNQPVDTTINVVQTMAYVQWLRLVQIYPNNSSFKYIPSKRNGRIYDYDLREFVCGELFNKAFRKHVYIVQSLREEIVKLKERIPDTLVSAVFEFIAECSIPKHFFCDRYETHNDLSKKMKCVATRLIYPNSLVSLLKDEVTMQYAVGNKESLFRKIQDISTKTDNEKEGKLKQLLLELNHEYFRKRPTESLLFV